jgi:hypothetical protein
LGSTKSPEEPGLARCEAVLHNTTTKKLRRRESKKFKKGKEEKEEWTCRYRGNIEETQGAQRGGS